jgi:hypothetical protein
MENIKTLIKTYKHNKAERINKRAKMAYILESGKSFTLDTLERKEQAKQSIFDFFKHKYFLESKTENQAFLFITFTLNPKHNIKENEEYLKALKRQNEVFEYFNNGLLKHNKADYIKIKETTKKGNLHIHSLYKVEKSKIFNFVNYIYNKQGDEDIGIVNIKSEKGEISTIPEMTKKYNFNPFLQYNKKKKEYKEIKAIIRSNLSHLESENKLRGGVFIELDELEQFDGGNVLNYILKYIKKNMETNENNENNEHIIFKLANIKKLTTSNIASNKIKKDFLNYYYYFLNTAPKEEKGQVAQKNLLDMFLKGEQFEEWKEYQANYKKQEIKELNLTILEDLQEFLSNKLQETQKESFYSHALINILLNAADFLNRKEHITDIIKEEAIILKISFENEKNEEMKTIEDKAEKKAFRNYLKYLNIGKKQFLKMNELELLLLQEQTDQRKRKYIKKLKVFEF